MYKNIIQQAENFINNETQYHLGFLPIEQSNPKTRHLDKIFEKSCSEGINTLLAVDRDLTILAKKFLKDERFKKMENSIYQALINNKKIIFSGCGATGRMSILLESYYRNYFNKIKTENHEIYKKISCLENSVFSIMTGGDYALIKSVEFFEDYQEFGRRQVRELDIKKDDVLIASTGTGETSSILGTVIEASDRQACVFTLICVPARIPMERLERSRTAFSRENVTVIDMPCGAMAVSGSTRMQSTTLEQLIAGAALEKAMNRAIYFLTQNRTDAPVNFLNLSIDYYQEFKNLLDALEEKNTLSSIASYIEFEEMIYKKQGLITYYADDFLLDILTDTTERSPTFMLPPFCKKDDNISQQSWAFVKNAYIKNKDIWKHCLGRNLRCLDWNTRAYRQMGAGKEISSKPPKINNSEMMKFLIGSEIDPQRLKTPDNAAVYIGSRAESAAEIIKYSAGQYKQYKNFLINKKNTAADFFIKYKAPKTPLRLFEHLAVKLLMNIISTGVMVKMGRIRGNWMTWLDISNKKLIDRGIRIISELCNIDYRTACIELFISQKNLSLIPPGQTRPSPVQHTIERLKK